ncbi:MAG: hypothetical protein IPO92_20135 [Saprospiraceae bacterium]|nr:hypothetical protein [Saprospiraceae bacterium]
MKRRLKEHTNQLYLSKHGRDAWIGGNQLQSFDGHRFNVFPFPNKNPTITHIFEDNRQRLFIIDNYVDIYFFDRKTETFRKEVFFNNHEFQKNNFRIIQVLHTKSGKIIFNLEKAIGYLDMEKTPIQIVKSPIILKTFF